MDNYKSLIREAKRKRRNKIIGLTLLGASVFGFGCESIRINQNPVGYNLSRKVGDYLNLDKNDIYFDKSENIIIDPKNDKSKLKLDASKLEKITDIPTSGVENYRTSNLKTITDIFPCNNPEGKQRKIIGFYILNEKDKFIDVSKSKIHDVYNVTIADGNRLVKWMKKHPYITIGATALVIGGIAYGVSQSGGSGGRGGGSSGGAGGDGGDGTGSTGSGGAGGDGAR